MRVKYFLITLGILVLTVVLTSIVHFRFFSAERLRLIDQQVEAIASGLLAYDFEATDLDETSAAVADTLGDEHPTALVSVYSRAGKLLYRNNHAIEILATIPEIPATDREMPAHYSLHLGNHDARFLQLRFGGDAWILQVGLLLDQGQIRWQTLSESVLKYLAAVLLLMLAGAWLLSGLLLRPVRSLSEYLQFLTRTVSARGEIPALPADLEWVEKRRTDAFSELVSSVRKFAREAHSQLLLGRATTAQMAHELKTPLTVIRNCFERGDPHSAGVALGITETEHLTTVIDQFLNWSRMGASVAVAEVDVHAIHLGKRVEKIAERLSFVYGERLQVSTESDVILFARPEWVDQALQNLLDNALKYSPSASRVKVEVRSGLFRVSDEGTGLPAKVVERLGQPFNVGEGSGQAASSRGTGLGLAWVLKLAELYGWRCDFASSDRGLVVSLTFPTHEP